MDLTPGFRKEGATFDRFGVHNMMKSGGAATMFFDDLQANGHSQEFSKDPDWVGTGNRVTFEDREQVGAHDFGFSAKTSHAGGTPGEIGGGLWRSGDFGYYADRVGPLNLEQRLEARGKVKLVTAGPDSDMSLGWFNSAPKPRSMATRKTLSAFMSAARRASATTSYPRSRPRRGRSARWNKVRCSRQARSSIGR